MILHFLIPFPPLKSSHTPLLVLFEFITSFLIVMTCIYVCVQKYIFQNVSCTVCVKIFLYMFSEMAIWYGITSWYEDSEVMDIGGKSIPTTLLNQHNPEQQSKYLSLYPQISIALSFHQRNLSLLQIEIITENHNQSTYRVEELVPGDTQTAYSCI